MSKQPAVKVLLTAFGGQLQSKTLINWPADKIGQDIYLLMDMESPSFTTKPDSSIKIYESTTKTARFEFSGGYSITGDMPAVYKLVGVEL